jgi:N-methylhydantoinase B
MSRQPDPIRLEVFKHLYSSIAEEMGVVLRRASYSPNIKERRDFSCAVFDAKGKMIAQAAHIPVHLGSMPLSVAAAIEKYMQCDGSNQNTCLNPGDAILLNDPFRGGTHLPDLTLVSPVFLEIQPKLNESKEKNPDQADYKPILVGFVASRAHHADIGGMTPGSMSISREIYQEGLIIPPVKFLSNGNVSQELLDLILANVRTPQERSGDLYAQVAANQRGASRLRSLVQRYGFEEIEYTMGELISYAERMTRQFLKDIPNGTYTFTDHLDDNGVFDGAVPIQVAIIIEGDEAIVDFSGSARQQIGSVNAVYAITLSAVSYVFRCLLSIDVPNNSGCLEPIKIIAPKGTIINAQHPAPVAAGNVETSQRIVDVLLGALHTACPDRIPAASQGTMNNITIGGLTEEGLAFTYYETVGGGIGAGPWGSGPSALHSHMTNTMNTPAEAVEYAYPLRILRYEIRQGSGGTGRHFGGDGIRRDIQSLVDSKLSLITERRISAPYGLSNGDPGSKGENLLIRDGKVVPLPGKGVYELEKGDILSIRTPGGGGFGKPNTG